MAEIALRGQLVHQLFEGKILMRVGAQGDLADPPEPGAIKL